MAEMVTLNPDDPFDQVLIDIVNTNRKKRKDYAHDGSDPFTNFKESSSQMAIDGFDAVAAADFNIAQKNSRLRSLRINGRMDDPQNEAVIDTYLDRAVYAIIAYALFREKVIKPQTTIQGLSVSIDTSNSLPRTYGSSAHVASTRIQK